jgi:hypothetical protein
MKRPSLTLVGSDSSEDELQSSLKRVRISTSPGELRLDKDLAQLEGWNGRVHFRDGCVLERPEALRVTVTCHKRLRVCIGVSRMYPHDVPKVLLQQSYEGNHRSSEPVEISQWWTPIKTLSDLLDYILPRVISASCSRQKDQQEEFIIMDHEYLDGPAKHQSRFDPKRFDVGYDRSTPVRDMDCLDLDV